MKKYVVLGIVAVTLNLAGCQNLGKTMFAHIRIAKPETAWIAQGNAFTNFCQSKNLLDRQLAFQYSIIAAEMLDLVVFDNDFYKSTYEYYVNGLNSAHANNPSESVAGCKKVELEMPSLIANMNKNYRDYAQQLGVARAEESQRLAETMRNFQLPNTPIPQVPQASFPNFSYSNEQPQSINVLVNTKSGITTCKVTKNSFVFCL